jgi:DNA-binding NarL/FixJ family response regulator
LVIVTGRQLIRDALLSLSAGAGWMESTAAPTVVVLEASDALESLAGWRQQGVGTVVIAVAGGRPTAPELLAAGADAVVLESSPGAEFLTALEHAARHERFLATDIGEEGEWHADPLAGLSARERQVFWGLVEGRRSKDIAAELELSPKTVDSYRASLMAKLGIREVAGLVRYAVRHKLIQDI